MSNFYPKSYRSRPNNNNFRNRQNQSYHEKGSWKAYDYSNLHWGHNNRSHEWFQQNWQWMQSENYYTNQNFNAYGNCYRNSNHQWPRGRNSEEPKRTLDIIPQETQIKHINNLREYLQDDDQIYYDFKGLSLNESAYVSNLCNLSYDNNGHYGIKLKEAVSGLCDVLKVIESKLNLEVICEECNDQTMRNVTYTKILKEPSNRNVIENGDLEQADENSRHEKSGDKVMMIMKEDLYKNSADVEDDISTSDNDNDWTRGLWEKSRETAQEVNDDCIPMRDKSNRRMTKLLETYSTPVESDKAQRMMEKMGWAGGALGAKADGIINPIVPNVTFKLGAGLGHTHMPKRKKLKGEHQTYKSTKMEDKKLKEVFTTNVLRYVLDFLRDDELEEICFDNALLRGERRSIHVIVQCLGSDTDIPEMDILKTTEQISLVSEISENMTYTLGHESEGNGMNRKLYLYKTAPEDVYLITPKDLVEESYEENYNSTNESENMKTSETSVLPVENMGNSLKENSMNAHSLNNEFNKEASRPRWEVLKDLLRSFVKEFCEEEGFTELRFLGRFDAVDAAIVNWFMADLEYNLRNHDVESKKCTKDLEILYENQYYDFDVYLKERKGSILYVLQKTKKTENGPQEVCD